MGVAVRQEGLKIGELSRLQRGFTVEETGLEEVN